MSWLRCRAIIFPALALLGCSPVEQTQTPSFEADAALEDQTARELRSALDDTSTDVPFTLMLQTASGATFAHSVGASSAETLYKSASTSKWVTAAIVMYYAEAGVISLSDNPQDYIDSWPASGPLSEIQLYQLLNFTSGLNEDPLCLDFGVATFENCVRRIAEDNGDTVPLTNFDYGSSHLQVAGAMLVGALGPQSSWKDVFADFSGATGLFKHGAYDLPSASNPRLAGGMHWTASDYLGFLSAMYNETFLSRASLNTMNNDTIGSIDKLNDPAFKGTGEDWRYGYGCWIECHASAFDCEGRTRVSSPGAYGAYPFIDYEHNYFGVLARQGSLGTFPQGYQLIQSVEAKLIAWSQAHQ